MSVLSDKNSQTGYRIVVKGHLNAEWSEWFEGLKLDHEAGQTILSGKIVDQAALFGILCKIRDLNLQLISVNQINPEKTEVFP